MRQTLNPGPHDTISVYDDWGYADGIQITSKDSEVILYVLTDAQLAAYRTALDTIEADRKRRAAMHERNDDSDYELSGFESEVA